jgi:hypothetical protein
MWLANSCSNVGSVRARFGGDALSERRSTSPRGQVADTSSRKSSRKSISVDLSSPGGERIGGRNIEKLLANSALKLMGPTEEDLRAQVHQILLRSSLSDGHLYALMAGDEPLTKELFWRAFTIKSAHTSSGPCHTPLPPGRVV